MRTRAFETVSSLTGTITRLESIGIDFRESTNKLEIADSDKLDAALENNAAEVSILFTQSSGGLAKIFDSFLETYLSSSGALATQVNSLESQNKDLDEQIERMERFIATQEERLTASFIQMEQMQAEINRQSQALSRAFGSS
ncbi:flagellar filament capping protein FliD [bacterium]|nr:flagellar filament capping protein FliD [bacterium]